MPKRYPRLAAPIEEPHGEGPLPFADDNFDERFYALLDDDDLEEVFREFLVPVQRGG